MGSRTPGNNNLYSPIVVVDKAAQRGLTAAMVGLIVSWIVILSLVIVLGFMFTELKISMGMNQLKDKRINSLKHQYEIICRKDE